MEREDRISWYGADAAVDIWLEDLKRGVLSRFTFGPKLSEYPVWSPDASRIIYRRHIRKAKEWGDGFFM